MEGFSSEIAVVDRLVLHGILARGLGVGRLVIHIGRERLFVRKEDIQGAGLVAVVPSWHLRPSQRQPQQPIHHLDPAHYNSSLDHHRMRLFHVH